MSDEGHDLEVSGTNLCGGTRSSRHRFRVIASAAGRAVAGDTSAGYETWLAALREKLRPLKKEFFSVRTIGSPTKSEEKGKNKSGPDEENSEQPRLEEEEVIRHVCQASMKLCELFEDEAYARAAASPPKVGTPDITLGEDYSNDKRIFKNWGRWT